LLLLDANDQVNQATFNEKIASTFKENYEEKEQFRRPEVV